MKSVNVKSVPDLLKHSLNKPEESKIKRKHMVLPKITNKK